MYALFFFPLAGFGNFSFGAPAAAPAAAPATGGFGGASTGFGGFGGGGGTNFSGFGTTTATTSAPAFGFGTQTTAAAGAPPAFGGFGTAAQPQQQQTLGATTGGFSGFGTAQTQQPAPAFGGLGAPAATSTGFGGFGTGGFGGFNSSATTTTTTSMFGKFGATNPTTSNFGGAGGFGTGLGMGFGQPQQQQSFMQPQQQQSFMQPQQQQQAAPLSSDEALAQSIFNVAIFGDERDMVIAKWNYLQAMWGTGKLFYSQSCPPLEIAPTNYLCRFKTIGYNKIPGKDNKLGFVSLIFDKPFGQIKEQEQRIIQQLNQFFGNKPTIIITIDSIKSQSATNSLLMFHVDEKSQISTESKRIPAMDIYNCLNQPMTKQNIMNMGVINIVPLVHPDDDQLKEYLDNPPKGIDPRMWAQAKKDNPNPSKFIPVPIIGFNELQWRIKCQETETETHKQYLVKVQHDLGELKQRHATTTAKIMEHKRKFAELSHRILQVNGILVCCLMITVIELHFII